MRKRVESMTASAAAMLRLELIQKWERDWWQTASDEERAWYDLHLRRTVKECADRLAREHARPGTDSGGD